MTATIPNVAFQALYGIASCLVVLFTVQSFHYARRHPSWGAWSVAAHFACKVVFIADLFLLRGLSLGSASPIWGVNGIATFAIRLAWIGTLAVMVEAGRRGAILDDGSDDIWDGTSDRRTVIRRAEDRERVEAAEVGQ